MIQIEFDEDFECKLDAVCEMVGTNKAKIIVNALKDFVNKYCDTNGNFSPRKGILYENRLPDGTWNKLGQCYILDECSVVGTPYYTIFWDGKLVKAPQYCVDVVHEDNNA